MDIDNALTDAESEVAFAQRALDRGGDVMQHNAALYHLHNAQAWLEELPGTLTPQQQQRLERVRKAVATTNEKVKAARTVPLR